MTAPLSDDAITTALAEELAHTDSCLDRLDITRGECSCKRRSTAAALLSTVRRLMRQQAAEELRAAADDRWTANGGYPTDWLRDRADALTE